MAEKKTTPVFIDDKEYTFEEMTPEQQEMVDHVADLERKISSGLRNIRQMEGGRTSSDRDWETQALFFSQPFVFS